jgi:hypothetical protein
MELQVGEKIVCIKGRISHGNLYAIKGKIYNILDIKPSAVLVNCEENGIIEAADYRRYTRYEIEHEDYLFAEHFISLKESRKLKLKKLSVIN